MLSKPELFAGVAAIAITAAIFTIASRVTVVRPHAEKPSCVGKPLTFREFYAMFNGGAPMLGANGEMIPDVVRRQLDTAADFLDYRAGWQEKCR